MAKPRVVGGRHAGGPRPKLEHPGLLIKRLMKLVMKRYAFAIIVVLFCILGSALVSVKGTLFLQELIDVYIVPMIGSPNPDYSSLLQALSRIGLLYAAGVILVFLQGQIMARVGQGTLHSIRVSLFRHMETLPIKYFDTHPHGDIMSVYTNDVDALRQMIGISLPQLISSILTICSVLFSMIYLSLPLTIVSVSMVVLMVVISGKMAKLSGKFFVKQQADLGALNGFIEEMMDGQKVVKVFNHEQESIDIFLKKNEQLRESADQANKIANILMPINVQLGNIGYVIVATAGALFSLSGYFGITLGVLVSFLSLNRSFTMPIAQVSQQLNSVIMALAGADRIFRLMDAKSEEDDGDVIIVRARQLEDGSLTECEERTGIWAWKQNTPEGPAYSRVYGNVTLENVDFGYTDEKLVLQDINMFAKPGQKLAFVGSTGAGKTTITNLINRFYDIQNGTIYYDGIDIRRMKKQSLRKTLGMVLQDTHLFTGTVLDNIRYGRLTASDEECIEAAKLANADSFISKLPDGYQTMLTGDGANLSQGQRQLLAIARAAVVNPMVLILDEATSSIDTRTEQHVQQGMDSIMQGRTTFVIAHRLSTIYNSNCIMVLEGGRVIERGTHEELLAQKGRYYGLSAGTGK